MWGGLPRKVCASAQDWGQVADYPKGWQFPTKRLATSTSAGYKLCLMQKFVFPTKRLATSTSAGYKLCLMQKFVLGLEKRH